MLDLKVDLTATFQTPFDADEIALDAVFQLPSGKSMKVPGFYGLRTNRSKYRYSRCW
jgi:hypothetical protein